LLGAGVVFDEERHLRVPGGPPAVAVRAYARLVGPDETGIVWVGERASALAGCLWQPLPQLRAGMGAGRGRRGR